METKAHLELLVAQGRATRDDTPDGVLFAGDRPDSRPYRVKPTAAFGFTLAP